MTARHIVDATPASRARPPPSTPPEARCAAENVAATLRGSASAPSRSRRWARWGRSGIARPWPRSSGSKLSGFLAWWLWRTVYLMKLPGLDRKIRVAVDWTLDLLLPADIVQLRTDRSVASGASTSSRGRSIFREGDHGDWLYIVDDGEVEVLKHVAARARCRYGGSAPATASARSRSSATTCAPRPPIASPASTASP